MLLAISGMMMVPGALPSAQATPYSGAPPGPTNLLLYLHNSTAPIPVGSNTYLNVLSTQNDTASPWRSTGALEVGRHYLSSSYVVAPQLAGPWTVSGALFANLWMNETGSSPSGGSVTISAYAVSASGARTLLGNGPATGTSMLGPGGSLPQLVNLPGPTIASTTLPTGSTMMVNITVSGNSQEGYGLWWGLYGGTWYFSDLVVPSTSYLEIPEVSVTDHTGATVTALPENAADKSVTIHAVDQDPLGAYDFDNWSVQFVVENATWVAVAGPVTMTASPAPARTDYQANYSAPYNYSALAPGTYHVNVSATDNSNHDLAGQNTLPAYYGRLALGTDPIVVGAAPVPVFVHVIDTSGNSLTGAHVIASPQGATGPLVSAGWTDSTGSTTLSLPAGANYGLNLYWENVPVGVYNLTLAYSASQAWANTTARVFSPTLHLSDSSGRAVPFPLVFVRHPNGTDLPMQVANGAGDLGFSEVPLGSYGLNVVFDDVMVLSGASFFVAHGGQVNATVPAVYLLTVDTKTSSGSALDGVFVQVINTATGATIASGTSVGGVFSVLVPAGTYYVNGTFEATYDLTPISQTVSQTVTVSTADQTTTLSFSKAFPAIFQTTLFLVGLAIGVLVVLLLLALVWGVRRSRAGRSKGRSSSSAPSASSTSSTPASSSSTEGSGSSSSSSSSKS